MSYATKLNLLHMLILVVNLYVQLLVELPFSTPFFLSLLLCIHSLEIQMTLQLPQYFPPPCKGFDQYILEVRCGHTKLIIILCKQNADGTSTKSATSLRQMVMQISDIFVEN